MITYLRGDATRPKAEGPKIIAHIVNDIGKWGKGFVLAISNRWEYPKANYVSWWLGKETENRLPGARVLTTGPCKLGHVQFVEVEPDLFIANMVGQHGIAAWSGAPPIRYQALQECLDKLIPMANMLRASIHMPRIGCGLAGGTWKEVEPIVRVALDGHPVFVYDYEPPV